MIHYLRFFYAPSQAKRNYINSSPPNTSKHIISILFFVSFYFFLPSLSLAENLNSDSFNIQMSTINITGGNKSSSSYKLGDTVGQTFQGQFDSAGFRIKAGFQYINSLIPFSFVISDIDLPFGSLIALSPSTVTNQLTISTGTAHGYNIKTIADHSLQSNSNPPSTIPDTTCNAGTPCTINQANVWTAYTTSFGLGYNMSGEGVDTSDFVNSTYFKPFPNNSLSQTPVTVMSSNTATVSATSTVTYQINISNTQAAGNYSNGIQFIATPIY